MTRSILVVGGAGCTGSAFINYASSRNNNIIVVDLSTHGKGNISTKVDKLIQCDINNHELINKTLVEHNIDIVINFVAESYMESSILYPARFVNTNVIGTFNLLQCSFNYFKTLSAKKRQDFRYIHVSCSSIYGSNMEITEKSAIQPTSPYSATKAASYHFAQVWHHMYKLPVITVSSSNKYGPRQNPTKLIPMLITRALGQQALQIYGNGKHLRDWIHINDYVLGIYLALERGTPGETYCFHSNESKTNTEVAQTICDILDTLKPLEAGSYSNLIKFVADRKGHDAYHIHNTQKVSENLGFQCKIKFETGIEETIKWYLENKEWYTKPQENKLNTGDYIG